MPRSGLDGGLDLDHTDMHLRSGLVEGAVPNFSWRSGSGFSLC